MPIQNSKARRQLSKKADQPRMDDESQEKPTEIIPKVFEENEVRRRIIMYRQGIMEMKQQKESLEQQLHDLEGKLLRTEGAVLGLSMLLSGEQGE